MKDIDERFERYNNSEGPGLAVLVVKDGKAIYKRGFGLADLSNRTKITPNTIFDIGSISKQFTGMAIAMLEERGVLSTGDRISKYLSTESKLFSDISIYHLLHHISGLPDFEDDLCFESESKPLIGNKEVADFYVDKELNFPSGEQFEYSNAGYVLLALVIESATGVSFQQFLQDEILIPVGMENTHLVGHDSPVSNFARSYSEWPFFDNIDFNTCSGLYGDGRIHTSINDYHKWIHALESHSLVSIESTEKIFRAETKESGVTKGYGYGYGWFGEDFYGHYTQMHSGGWLGFNTRSFRFPSENLWIVVFSNSYAISSYDAFEYIAKKQLDIIT